MHSRIFNNYYFNCCHCRPYMPFNPFMGQRMFFLPLTYMMPNYTIFPLIPQINLQVDLFKKTYASVLNNSAPQSVWNNEDISPSYESNEVKSPKINSIDDKVPAKVDGEKLGAGFIDRVKLMAKNLNCDYKDLLALFNSESALNPQTGLDEKTGKIKGAVGLIQFTDKAIEELNRKHNLNLTKEKILKMSAIEQLDIAEKYLKIAKSRIFADNERLSAGNLYAITFLPGRANRSILCTSGEKNSKGELLNYYEENTGLDINKDGKITKDELAQRLQNKRVNESVFA